ncbi:MAG: sulfotransferase [Pseudomonadota bacterium]
MNTPALPRPGPDFIIIGAMKSATSTLHVQLAQQPGFWMSTPKEPNFFSDEDVWARGLDWYAALFEGAARGDLRGESSTHYTKLPDYPQCLGRMREHVPDARLIYVMRHPVDRLISHYMHGWLNGSIRGSVDEAVQRYPELVHYGCYAKQLRPFLETYGPDKILPVFFERLTQSPQAELERVCAFLGYEGSPAWQTDEAQQNVSLERMRTSPLRDAIVGFPPIRAIRRTLVPQSVRDRIKGLWQIDEKPELSPASLDTVKREFDADLAELGAWLGTPLSTDTFKQSARSLSLDWTQAAPRPTNAT